MSGWPEKSRNVALFPFAQGLWIDHEKVWYDDGALSIDSNGLRTSLVTQEHLRKLIWWYDRFLMSTNEQLAFTFIYVIL